MYPASKESPKGKVGGSACQANFTIKYSSLPLVLLLIKYCITCNAFSYSFWLLPPPKKEVMFSLLLICLFVCLPKNTEKIVDRFSCCIFMKLG